MLPADSIAAVPPPVLRSDAWRIPFEPLFQNPDLQTIIGRYWPQSLDERRFPSTERLFRTDPTTQVLAKLNALSGDEGRALVLSVHGLTACDRAPYMLTSAQAALDSGFDSMRLNVRNCGGTEGLCQTLYHSGLSADLKRVVEELAPRPVYLLGFSMGGNIILKLAGEWGDDPPAHVRGICVVSVPVRLDLCCHEIGRRRNWIYEQRFLWQLRAAVRRKRAAVPDCLPDLDGVRVPSIWEFDEVVTAPHFGFRDAADYYSRCSSAWFLESIRVPTLLLLAQDDPFIPFESYDLPALSENGFLRLVAPPHGGHVSFLAKGRHRFWAIRQACRFFDALRVRASGH